MKRHFLGWNPCSIGKRHWVKSAEILKLFDDTEQYKQFMDDHLGLREALASLKYELADHGITY